MSSRIVTGKRAASIVDSGSGTVYYAIFEEGYDSNIFPKERRWGAALLATAGECMERIIDVSPSCEGGSLKGANGDITASAYIKQWRDALAGAYTLATERVYLRFAEGHRGLKAANRAAIAPILLAHGRTLADDAQVIEIDLRQPGSVDMLAALIDNDETGVSAWKCLDVTDARGPGSGIAVAVPPTEKVALDGVAVWRLPASDDQCAQESNYVLSIDGVARFCGWQYVTVGRFIHQVVVAAEAAKPGVAEGLIRAFKKLLAGAPQAEADTMVALRRDAEGVSSHERKRFDGIAKEIGRNGASIETTVGELAAAKQIYELGCLRSSQLTFHFARPASQLGLVQ